jgi:hypothetical protein
VTTIFTQLGRQVRRLGNHPDAGFGTSRTGDDSTNVVGIYRNSRLLTDDNGGLRGKGCDCDRQGGCRYKKRLVFITALLQLSN